MDRMRRTRYFDEQVMRKRTYLTEEICRAVIAMPGRRQMQEDRRLRFWGEVCLPGETEVRMQRVVTLEDGRRYTTPSSIAAIVRTSHEAALLPRDG